MSDEPKNSSTPRGLTTDRMTPTGSTRTTKAIAPNTPAGLMTPTGTLQQSTPSSVMSEKTPTQSKRKTPKTASKNERTPKNAAGDRPTWIYCPRCRLSYSSTDVRKHEEVCNDVKSLIDLQLIHDVHSSFVYNGSLVAKLSLITAKYSDNWRGNFVYLHPDTIAAAGFSVEDLKKAVILDRRLGFRVWPCDSIATTCIGVDALGLRRLQKKNEERVTLVALEKDRSADEIHLTYIDENLPFLKNPEQAAVFTDEFLYANEDRLFCVGEKVEFSYCGNSYYLVVRKIKVDMEEYGWTEDQDGLELVETMSLLNISEEKPRNSSVSPSFSFLCAGHTRLVLCSSKKRLTLDAFGGYSLLKDELLCLVQTVLKGPHRKDKQESITIRSQLLIGPPGVGKTTLVHALANTCEVPLICLTPENVQKNNCFASLKKILNEILDRLPCIVMIDQLDVVCSKKDLETTEAVCSMIRHLIRSQQRVFVFGLTNKLDNVHEFVRHSDLLPITRSIPLPSAQDRAQIFNCVLRSVSHSLTERDVQELATGAQYFSGYDVSCLCIAAVASRRSQLLSQPGTHDLHLTFSDMVKCLPSIEPYSLKTLRTELQFVKVVKSDVTWEDIGGLRDVQRISRELIHLRIFGPEVFDRLRLEPLKGLLLFGPNGCGKTMVAKAIANDSRINFMAVEGSSMFGKFVGSTEGNIARLFQRARELSPCTIFFDEAERVALRRDQEVTPAGSYQNRALQQILVELDGIATTTDAVCILAATSRPELLDAAFFRPGRFDRVVYIPLPDHDTRCKIFEVRSRKLILDEDVDLDELAARTEGYSSAEICSVVRMASDLPRESLYRNLSMTSAICTKHFEIALLRVRPRTTPKQIAVYEEFARLHSH